MIWCFTGRLIIASHKVPKEFELRSGHSSFFSELFIGLCNCDQDVVCHVGPCVSDTYNSTRDSHWNPVPPTNRNRHIENAI